MRAVSTNDLPLSEFGLSLLRDWWLAPGGALGEIVGQARAISLGATWGACYGVARAVLPLPPNRPSVEEAVRSACASVSSIGRGAPC